MTNLQVTLNQDVDNVYVANVVNFQAPDASATTYQELADAIRQSFDDNVNAFLSANWSLNSVTIRNYDGGGPFSTEVAFTSGPLSGIAATQTLMRQAAMLIATTYNGPKPNRGRFYLAGTVESAWAGSSWASVDLADAVAMLEEWRDGLVTTAGSCFLRIARVDDPTNTWLLNNPVENVIGRTYAATIKGRVS